MCSGESSLICRVSMSTSLRLSSMNTWRGRVTWSTRWVSVFIMWPNKLLMSQPRHGDNKDWVWDWCWTGIRDSVLSLGVTVYSILSNAECTCEICETHVTTCFARSSNSQVVDWLVLVATRQTNLDTLEGNMASLCIFCLLSLSRLIDWS